jgi:hypothetical protein
VVSGNSGTGGSERLTEEAFKRQMYLLAHPGADTDAPSEPDDGSDPE